MRNRSAAFLAAGVIGVAALLLGQAWDFYLHAADPTLAHREGIFTLTNPGHVLLGAGLILAVVGVLGAAYSHLEIVHYVNRAYSTDADILKPQHVQSLIYYNSPKGPVLIGAMYIMPRWGMPGPEIGGALTSWHHHDDLCFDKKTSMVVAFAGLSIVDRP